MPPEILKKIDLEYDGKKADIFSCGVLLFCMIFNQYPFEFASDKD